ncbi:hypothetical protein Bca4012_025176 [Brassica carinata]
MRKMLTEEREHKPGLAKRLPLSGVCSLYFCHHRTHHCDACDLVSISCVYTHTMLASTRLLQFSQKKKQGFFNFKEGHINDEHQDLLYLCI